MASTNQSSDHRRADPAEPRPLAAIILAAGKGTRMAGDLPKVAHQVAGRSIVQWVVEAVRAAGAERIVLVVGYKAEVVKALFAGDDHDLVFAIQEDQLGTGHATQCAESALTGFEGDVLVLAGDGPLIRASTIETMRERHVAAGAGATLATSVIEDPTGYGRIVRDEQGGFVTIVEHRNATEAQRAIREVYPSYACFDGRLLFEMLRRLEPNDASGEYYVTDLPMMIRASGGHVELVDAVPPEDVLSINTPGELAVVEAILLARVGTVQR